MFGYHPVLGSLKSSLKIVTIFGRLGDYVMCPRTQLGSSKMGFRGQVFCLPYLVFTQHSIISTFFPEHSNDKKKKKKATGLAKKLIHLGVSFCLTKKPERTFWHTIFVLHPYDYNISG